MAAQKNPRVHLETVEDTQNIVSKSTQIRHHGEVRLDGGDEQERLLVPRGNQSRKRAISNKRLARARFFDLSLAYESIQSACIGHAIYRTVRTVR